MTRVVEEFMEVMAAYGRVPVSLEVLSIFERSAAGGSARNRCGRRRPASRALETCIMG